MRPLKIKASFAYATLTFVNEFVKWSRPLNSIGRLKIGHPGWHFSKPVLELSTTESSFVPEGTNGLKTLMAIRVRVYMAASMCVRLVSSTCYAFSSLKNTSYS